MTPHKKRNIAAGLLAQKLVTQLLFPIFVVGFPEKSLLSAELAKNAEIKTAILEGNTR